MRSSTALRLAGALALGLAGCVRPSPPEITPEKATITSVTESGIGLDARMLAYNPNRFDLTAREVHARLTLDHKIDVGAVTSTKELTLPAGQKTALVVPLAVAWSDLPAVVTLAASARNVPYDVDGTVTVGGDVLHADVPFHMEGTLSHAELVEATKRSLPPLPIHIP